MYGLVLEGGGTKGAYQLGVYKALMEEGVEISGITGTSIGALNGAILAQGDYEACKELWENLDYSMIINTNEEEIERLSNLDFSRESFNYLKETLKTLIDHRGLDITPLKQMIDHYIDEDKIRNSQMDFGLVTVNVSELKPVEIFLEDMKEGELKDYLLASAYLPVFQTERIGENFYLDGGAYNNLPFEMLERKGYDKIILVKVHVAEKTKGFKEDGINRIIIEPREDLGGTLECDPKRSKYNMELGYYDGLRALRQLFGRKYYIESESSDDDYYFKKFLDLDEDRVRALGSLINEENENYRRLLLETIIPKLAFYLNLSKDFSYRELYLYLLENRIDYMELEKFQIYRESDLIERVKRDRLPEKKQENQGFMDKLKRTLGTISNLNRHEILLESSDIIFK